MRSNELYYVKEVAKYPGIDLKIVEGKVSDVRERCLMGDVGISFVAESTIKYNNLAEHPYYYKVGGDEESIRTLCVAYKKGKYIPSAGKKFIEVLKEELG